LDPSYCNTDVKVRNQKIISFFSQPISKLNREHFLETLRKLPPEYRALINEINDDFDAIVDSFGRVTYFYVKLGHSVIPIY
jgi:hypothetical protein